MEVSLLQMWEEAPAVSPSIRLQASPAMQGMMSNGLCGMGWSILARLRPVLHPLLYERIELICHRIELPDPIICPRKIFKAIAANVHFCWPQDAFAYYTLAGKKKVQRGSKTTPDHMS